MQRSRRTQGGFALISVLIAATIITVASLIASMFYVRAYARTDYIRDKVNARMRALTMLSELKHEAIANPNLMAAELQRHADGDGFSPTLTIERNEFDLSVAPDHPASNNQRLLDGWKWFRRVRVEPHQDIDSRDLRYVSVDLFRSTGGRDVPGTLMASASSLIRTLNPSYPVTQALDVYVLAMENVPGSPLDSNAAESMTSSALEAISARNPGLAFRVHLIRTMGYGRDDEYAPYVNQIRSATASTPWAHVYPHVSDGSVASYNPTIFAARVNVDGVNTPIFRAGFRSAEPFTDANGNGAWDTGETYTDSNANSAYDMGNPAPYALADAHNHCMRHADAERRQAARASSGAKAMTWRLLLDAMIANPDQYADALILNLHGEVLPVPAARNYSDAAKDPSQRPGWRVVTHPEQLMTDRTGTDDVAFRVYAYKSLPPGALGHSILSTLGLTDEPFMTQREPLRDSDANGTHDTGEAFVDWNGNGRWDDHAPITMQLRDIAGADAATLQVERLPGGVVTGWPLVLREPYRPFEGAPRLPEAFTDTNADGIRQVAEAWLDLDGNGAHNAGEPHQERDGDGAFSAADETLADANGNSRHDVAMPAETFTDSNLNTRWDAAEPYWDYNGNGQWDPPSSPLLLRRPWAAADGVTTATTKTYIDRYGEPYEDLDGDDQWDDAEPFFDANTNGVCDGGYTRGEMWFDTTAHADGVVVNLYGTPLETPIAPTVGLVAGVGGPVPGIGGVAPLFYLYDLEYVPCPMPDGAGGAVPFARDLAYPLIVPKNTARWRITIPSAALETRFAGAAEGGRLQVDTRIGRDLTTGSKWPVEHAPQNLSATYAYWVADAGQVPFSERYQFIGDPRHSPYADTDSAKASNRWFDDMNLFGLADLSGLWPGLAGTAHADGWNGQAGGHDLPRQLQWVRTALVRSGSILAGLSGRMCEVVSIGGDIGEIGIGVPMDGRPFGRSSDVVENTLSTNGTLGVAGSLKLVRSADGLDLGLRLGGAWWSKPWIGENFNDADYEQWRTNGNLLAATGSASGTYRCIPPSAVPLTQLPLGTEFHEAPSVAGSEGLNSLLGAKASAHQLARAPATSTALLPNAAGTAALEALHLGTRPYRLDRTYTFSPAPANANPEFVTLEASAVGRVTTRQVFIDAPGGAFGLAGLDLDMDNSTRRAGILLGAAAEDEGLAAVIQVTIAAAVETWFQGMAPGGTTPTRPIPRVEITDPSLATETEKLTTVPVEWTFDWRRWSGAPYVDGLVPAPTGQTTDWRVVPMFSPDEGETWRSVLTGAPIEPGVLPRLGDGSIDATQSVPATVGNTNVGWPVGTLNLTRGRYLVRIEALPTVPSQHRAWHMEAVFLRR